MSLNSTETQRYASGAILLHWLIALALAGEIALGFTMPKDVSGFALFQLHKSIGITILLLSVLRLVWRLTHKRPAKIEGGVTGFLASAVHVLFYAFMILAPLTGWAIVSSADLQIPTLLYGVVPWPHLPVPQSLNHTIEEAHELLAFFGIGLFVLHVAGALRHHFLHNDALIARMSPAGKAKFGLLLGAGVIAVGGAVFFGLGGPQSHEEEGQAAAEPAEAVAEPVEDAEMAAGDADAAAADEADAEAEIEAEAETEAEVEAEEEVAEPEVVATQEAAPEPAGPPPEWAIQPGGSLRFGVSNGDMRMNGSFGDWGGRIVMDPDNPETAEIAINIQLGSATLGDSTQDQMLKGADFLAASTFPTATFRSTSVSSLGGGRYRANGTLDIKGASRAQAITFTLSGSGNRRSVSGQALIDRNAFSVGTGSNAANLGGQVTVNFTFDATS